MFTATLCSFKDCALTFDCGKTWLTIRQSKIHREVARRCSSANDCSSFVSLLPSSSLVSQINFARRHISDRSFAANAASSPVASRCRSKPDLRILQRGGNAVDAGVATILAASVIEFSHFSFGGEVPILIKLKGQKGRGHRRHGPGADESHPRVLRQPRQAKRGRPLRLVRPQCRAPERRIDPVHWSTFSHRSSVLDACVTALDQFGTKTLAEVMEPAIQLADGFPIDELRVQYIKTRSSIFSQWAGRETRLSTRRRIPKVGDIFVQADLARTLREIVRAETRQQRHAQQSSRRPDGRARLLL